MAILGVLLGITMTVLGGCIWWGRKEILRLKVMCAVDDARIGLLEKRKAVITEAASAQPKPAGVRRQWNENMPAADR